MHPSSKTYFLRCLKKPDIFKLGEYSSKEFWGSEADYQNIDKNARLSAEQYERSTSTGRMEKKIKTIQRMSATNRTVERDRK